MDLSKLPYAGLAPAEERAALAEGSDLRLKAAPLLATFCAARE